MAKRTRRSGGDPPPETRGTGRGAGNSPTAIRRRERTWPATVTLTLREGMEPVSSATAGMRPAWTFPPHDKQTPLTLPFATGTDRLRVRLLMH